MDKTFEDCANDPENTVYYDYVVDDLRVLVLRGPGSVNAYIGVKPSHPLYEMDYDAIYDRYHISAHGGLTFSRMGEDGSPWPVGYWWIGWDYSHYRDACFYDLKHFSINWDDTQWTPNMINAEIPEVLEAITNSTQSFSI